MKHYNNADNPKKILKAFSASARPTVIVDVAKYQEFLDESGFTPDQKEELLIEIWNHFIIPLVEIGYGVHPLQEACGKECEIEVLGPAESPDAVRCEDQNSAKPLEKPAPPGKPEVK